MIQERNLMLFKRTYDKLSSAKKKKVDVDAILFELGVQLKHARYEEEISVSKMAEVAHLSTKTIWKIESGESVNFESIVKYLLALNYKIELKNDLLS